MMKLKSLLIGALCFTGTIQASETITLNIQIKEYNQIIENIHMVFVDEINFINSLQDYGYLINIEKGGLPESYISVKEGNKNTHIVEFKYDGCYSKSYINFNDNRNQVLSVCRGTKTISLTKN